METKDSITIAFDLDGVLVNLMDMFDRTLIKHHAGYVRIRNGQFKMETIPPLSNSQIWKVFYDIFERPYEIEIFPGVPDVLRTIARVTGRPIRIITARPEKFVYQTSLLVKRFTEGPVELFLVGDFKDKIKHLEGVDYFVEDRRATALLLATFGKTVFLMDRHYNQMTDDNPIWEQIIRIHDIREILDWLPVNIGESVN